ncbi:MAG: hypothetical protein EXR25_13580 [Limnohabitans sp.]|nr:hypothetical protein [Limnohabitans sp.]
MGIMESVKNWIQPQREPHTLYISIDEIPQPREWGTVQLTIGNDMLMSRDTSLEASATEELLGWIERNLPKIKASGYHQVQFENVAQPLQQRIRELLNG